MIGYRLARTGIEYGHFGWPLISGCDHSLQECAVADRCWARGAYRLHKYDFTPTLHPERLYAPMPRKPSRILVSFTGDMFADRWTQNADWQAMIGAMRVRMANHPEHSFLLLTKRPQNYALPGGPWPRNAWLGTSITGAETPQEQGARLGALINLEEGQHVHVCVSYEPVMGPLSSLAGAAWLVIGSWSGRKHLTPEQRAWVLTALRKADRLGIPVWVKDNCGLRYEWQELPKGMVPGWSG